MHPSAAAPSTIEVIMTKRFSTAAAVALALHGAAAMAADSAADRLGDIFSVRGFSTVGVVHSSEDKADFVTNVISSWEGAGASSSWSADVDSKLGLQIDATFTDRLSAVVQFISEDQTQNSWTDAENPRFRPYVEWANLKYQVTDALSVRAGRIVLPAQMQTEARKVGYASHWVRPPSEIYGFIPFTGSDGADVTYRNQFGGVTHSINAHYGKQSAAKANGIVLHPEITGINYTVEKGDLTARVAYARIEADLYRAAAPISALLQNYEGLMAGLPSGLGAAAAAESARLRAAYFDAVLKLDTYDIGMVYDPGQWFVTSELYATRNRALTPTTTAGYVSAGVRWNRFTPYATVSRLKQELRNEPLMPTAGLPAPAAALTAALNGALAGSLNSDVSQTTYAAGLRWDFMDNMDAKFQYQHIDLDDGSRGMFKGHLPGFELGSSADVVSLSVDFVF
jgi:hypothetical protein